MCPGPGHAGHQVQDAGVTDQLRVGDEQLLEAGTAAAKRLQDGVTRLAGEHQPGQGHRPLEAGHQRQAAQGSILFDLFV